MYVTAGGDEHSGRGGRWDAHMHRSNGVRCVLFLVSQLSYSPIMRLSEKGRAVPKTDNRPVFQRPMSANQCPSNIS